MKKKIVISMLAFSMLCFNGCGSSQPVSEVVQTEITEEGTVTEETETLEETEPTELEVSSTEKENDSFIETEETTAVENENQSVEQTTEETETQQTEEIEIVEELDTTMYASSGCNARSGDSTDFEKITYFEKGSAVHVTARTSKNWYRIDFEDGVAYISGSLLSTTKPSNNSNNNSGQSSNNINTYIDSDGNVWMNGINFGKNSSSEGSGHVDGQANADSGYTGDLDIRLE